MRPPLILLSLILACPSGAAAPPNPAAKVTVEVLFNKLSAKKNKIGALRPAMTVTPSRKIMIEDENSLTLVAWGGVKRMPDDKGGLDFFDYTSDGVFVCIEGGNLLYLSSAEGKFKKLLTLPSMRMGLAIGRDKIYLFERKGDGVNNGLFVLFHGKKSLKLFDSPQAIDAVLEDGDRLLFSTGGAIYQFSSDKKTSLLFAQQKGRPIISLAMNPKTRTIYGSDGASVFSINGDTVHSITRESGGVLRWLDDGLLLLDPKAPLLVRFVGLP